MQFDLSKLEVCFLAGTLGRGGAERQLTYMLCALGRAGASTRVLCLTRGEPFEHEIKALGVSVEWVGASGSRPARLYRIIQALRRRPADILQSVHFYTNLYTTAAARVVGICDIGAIRNDLSSEELKDNGIAGRRQLTFPRHLIANSSLARQRAISHGISPDRIDFVRNAVDPKWLKEKPVTNGQQTMRLLFVGRLTKQKRPDDFVRVVSRVVRQLPNRSLTARIVGVGPMRPHLEALAGELGLGPEKLEFLDERADMDAIYREADLMMMTSEWEGTPNALLEAMACGVPVVATSVGGIPEILADGRGLLTEQHDEDAMAAAVMRLIADAGLRREIGQRGREYIAEVHSLDVLQTQLMGTYQKVLSR
jgi:glycosyltransferase involved in cell wall biosynthesis